MAETSLHNDLKRWYALAGDEIEVPLDGYIVDIVRGDLLIEIQTRSFFSLRPKIIQLLANHPVHLVHPIAAEKWIVRSRSAEAEQTRRKSPKHGQIEHLFNELVSIPELILNPCFTLEILLTSEEEYWIDDGTGSWRRKGWRIADRKLVRVNESYRFSSSDDFHTLLPAGLDNPFTSSDLAKHAHIPRRLAQKMTYCLRRCGVIQHVGNKNREYYYTETGK